VQGLAITKSTVTAVTKPDGMVVLNADDPLVWQFADTRPAPVLAVSKVPDSTVIQGHLAAGGSALILMNGEMVWHHDGQDTSVLRADEVPITFGGRALHMVENAMHATAGALAVGIDLESVREGLKTFRSDAGLNPGRLNLFRTADGVSVLIDFAHNEAGVQHLLSLATTFVEKGKKLRTVAGSAGDRPDESIRAMLQMAAKASNGGVYLRETSKYLRGRASNAALIDLYRDALKDVSAKDCGVWPSEFEATCQAVKDSSSGDVVAVMAYEQSADIRSWLLSTGATPASG
jgi:cyanophycin synthetase